MKLLNDELEQQLANVKAFLKNRLEKIEINILDYHDNNYDNYVVNVEVEKWRVEIDKRWRECVEHNIKSDKLRKLFFSFSPAERLSFTPWKEYLANHELNNMITTKISATG